MHPAARTFLTGRDVGGDGDAGVVLPAPCVRRLGGGDFCGGDDEELRKIETVQRIQHSRRVPAVSPEGDLRLQGFADQLGGAFFLQHGVDVRAQGDEFVPARHLVV